MSGTVSLSPKRGGIHPIFGAFVGGGAMTADYKLDNPVFRCVSQLRTVKQLQNIQTSLEQARDNTASLKFHGNLEIDDTKVNTELDKKNFVEKVELLVETHGFHSFFYMKGADNKMYSLLTHSHLFTLTDVIQEHRKRSGSHDPECDVSGNETAESVLCQQSKYDVYEEYDCSLSRLAVQSVLGRSLQDDIKTRYSHLKDFAFLPGNVYFLMALEASNASVALDIDDAIDKFSNLHLNSFPGENVKGLATEALRLIKIMEGGYCLPLRLGSDLLKKVCSTSCEHFNRWIHTKLDEVRELEMKYKLKDPKLMTGDSLYSTLGPVALCGFLQEKYGSLVTEKAWPALVATLPMSNLALSADNSTLKVSEGRKCYQCGSPDHLRDTCPKLGRHTTPGKGKKGLKQPGGGGAADDESGTVVKPPTPPAPSHRTPFPAWRYIEPVDKKSAIVIGDVTYKWCSECRCRATGKQGYFTTSHFTDAHDDKRVTFSPPVNHSEVGPIVPLADDSLISADIPDEEALVFSGPWHCPLSDDWFDDEVETQDAIWMASLIEDTDDDDDECSDDSSEVIDVTHDDECSDDSSEVIDVTPPFVLVDTPIQRAYNTNPPVCTIDLEMTDLHRCDNPQCFSTGPDGFTCVSCSEGIYYTALVKCHHCSRGIGFLNDPCSQCHNTLYGERVVVTSLPGQHVDDYVDLDTEHGLNDRNLARLSYIPGNLGWYPPSVNLAAVPDAFFDCPEFLSSDDSLCEDHELISEPSRPEVTASLPRLKSSSFILRMVQTCLIMVSSWVFTVGFIRPLQWVITSLSALSESLCFWSFYAGTLCWDLVEVYLHNAPSPLPPRASRRRRHPSLCYFPRHWMVLSSLMLLSGFRSLSSFSSVFLPLQHTYLRCRLIARGVHMSPLTLYDLHHLRFRSLFLPLAQEETLCLPGDLTREQAVNSQAHNMVQGNMVQGNMTNRLSRNVADAHLKEDELFFDARSSLPFDPFNFDELLLPDSFINAVDMGFDATHLLPSRPGLNAALTGINFLDCLSPSQLNRFPVIFDSGASVAITGNQHDFVGELQRPFRELRLGGMAHGAKVEGIGIVHWTFNTGAHTLTLALRCYYVPDCKARLLSPQRLFNQKKGVTGQFSIREEHAILEIDNHPSLTLEYESTSHLPVGLATNGKMPLGQDHMIVPNVNLCITDDDNQNLTPAQKLLLMWHFRFGHRNLPQVQALLRLPVFQGDKYRAAARADLPKCATCMYAKAHLKHTSGNKSTTNLTTDGSLKDGCLRPGMKVSADHFESRLKGRTYTSFGKTTSDQYVGGCIFVDHMSGYIHVEHQLGFSSSETIRAKQNFEQMSLGYGVLVEDYLADNGIFNKSKFVDHIREHNQMIHYCGVNAHHKNGVAERGIRTVSEIARSLLLHASAHWPNGCDGSLWPMAVDYACYLYNTLPNHLGTCPADLFTGPVAPRHKLRDLHVWGCPVYVLDPVLQQGKKLPRWQPRSRRGLFLGYSPHHSSDVPLILNLQTGSISPQYHVVFDDSFSTVQSISSDETPPDFWTSINLDAFIHRIPIEPSDTEGSLLPDDWLTPHELEEKRRRLSRLGKIRESYMPSARDTTLRAPEDTLGGASSESVTTEQLDETTGANSTAPLNELGGGTPNVSNLPSSPLGGASAALGGASILSAASYPPTSETPLSPEPSGLRRSTRSNKGTFNSTKYIDEVYLSSLLDVPRSSHEAALAYHAELYTDLDTGDINYYDAHAYVAKLKKNDPDNPSYTEAMSGDDAEFYITAMQQEILALLRQRTWTRVAREEVPPNPDGTARKILKGTWAFKLKRLPDGTPLKYKARYCCRGDMQTEGVDYFDTYAPVVQWSTIRLVLTLALQHGWSTRQVDYTNAFAQADIQEEVYIEPPRGFTGKDGVNKVLKLRKSLYGLKQAPKTFFDKLRSGLLERGFTASNIDPCLFMKQDMICVVYVDDTILCGPDETALEAEIKGLGVHNLEKRHAFQLRNEGEVGDFLGIRIQKNGENKFHMTQTGLIDKVLAVTGMENCNPVSTPASREAIGSDRDGEAFDEQWKYSTVIGMLLYLSGNTRPDITFAVHQCARFSHNPRKSHAVAIKRILRYLKGTRDKGMLFSPVDNFVVNCYVDADFAGLWGVEYDQDPVSVKSRTGYLITFMGCPLLWASKMQTQIALSTMEAEYIALSAAMRELIAIREVLKEVKSIVFDSAARPSYSMIAKTFESLPQSTVFEDNDSCLKFASMPRMSPRTKHIAIPYHFFRSKVEQLEIQIQPIDTKAQLADQ
jgi:hypothetical protein